MYFAPPKKALKLSYGPGSAKILSGIKVFLKAIRPRDVA